MWPRSIQLTVRFTTSGQSTATFEARAQNQPVTLMKPTPCCCAVAATEASVCSSVSEARAVQLRIVEPDASRQSTGLRCWCGESPTTIVVAENGFTRPINADTARTAAVGGRPAPPRPGVQVTRGDT